MRVMVLGGALLALLPARQPQTPPPTDVFLMALGPPGADTWVNISQNPGYDNQPSFLPDSRAVLFSSNRDGKQTDIYRYDIDARRLTQLTRTPESEYSPVVTPDGRTFSTVRVEADGTQRLWRFDMDGSNPRLVLADVKPVGYHAWIDATRVALYVLGAGGAAATLQLADTATGRTEVIERGIGRSILVRPGAGTVTYLKTGPAPMLREFDPKTRVTTDLLAPIEGSQDAAWSQDGEQLLMAHETSIWVATMGMLNLGWMQHTSVTSHVMDTTRARVASVTRLAVSPDGRWLAFVAEPRPR